MKGAMGSHLLAIKGHMGLSDKNVMCKLWLLRPMNISIDLINAIALPRKYEYSRAARVQGVLLARRL